MGKGDRKSRKGRRRRTRHGDDVNLPKLAPIPKRQPNGQRRKRIRAATDPRTTVLAARRRLLGDAGLRLDRSALGAPWLGSGHGLALAHGRSDNEAARLWGVWQGYCSANRTYLMRIIGNTGDPKCATITMMPEHMETDQSHSVDCRSPEERDRDAVNRWMAWQGVLGHLGNAERRTIREAYHASDETMWHDGAPTPFGRSFATAVSIMADVVERC